MKLTKYTLIFLILNFAALAIGSWLMAGGPQKDWYLSLNKAPWTPPGWVFGAAWFTIMFCFSVYMAYLYKILPETKTIILFSIQWFLNVSWNYVFFNKQLISVGFIVILLLTISVTVFMLSYKKALGNATLLITPYFFWLIIATSLNAYILFKN